MRSVLTKTAILTAFGGALPLFFADAVPQKFSAEIRLKVQAATKTEVDSAAAALRSKRGLDNLIRTLNLSTDSEFAVDRPSAVRVVSDIVTGQEMTVAEAEAELRERLFRAIAVSYDQVTGQTAISVVAEQADEAAKIANLLGDTFRNELDLAHSGASGPVVEKLRRTLDHAEAALAGFMAEIDKQKLAEMRRTGSEVQQRGSDIDETEAQLADLKQKAAQASGMTLADVLAKPLPDALEYTGLDYQRQRHVEAKLLVDQLSGNLGPRHPKLLAAQAALDDVRNDIQDALRQLVTSLRQQESVTAKRLAELKARQLAKPADKEIADSGNRLRLLEAAVAEARDNYLAALDHSETKLPPAKVEVVAPATAAGATSLGLSLTGISALGACLGFCLGMAWALLSRRKPVRDIELAEIEPTVVTDDPVEADRLDDQADGRDDADDYDRPARHELLQDGEGHYRPPPESYPRYPEPANDVPFGDQIRDMLMANRRPAAQDTGLPPLVAATVSGRFAQSPVYSQPRMSDEEIRKAEEVRELRRHMAELRERVEVYSARRGSRRR